MRMKLEHLSIKLFKLIESFTCSNLVFPGNLPLILFLVSLMLIKQVVEQEEVKWDLTLQSWTHQSMACQNQNLSMTNQLQLVNNTTTKSQSPE